MLNANSFLYKLDTRVKILFILIFTILAFVVDKFPVCAALLLTILTLRLAWKIPFRSVKPLVTLSLLVIFMHITFNSGQNYIFKPIFGFSLKWDGLYSGLMIGCRLAALLLLLPVLTETTSPYEIALGLAGFGINYRSAFVITTSFNLIPLFREEGRAIMDAQRLRGSNSFEKGRFFAKLTAYPALVIPLVLGAMRKAQAVSVAMDSRAFGAFKSRTWLEKPVMKVHDYLSLAGILIFSFLALVVNIYLL
ncbi:MAG: energy-coupling factor transporter transmembrane protein EcfT [Treponema sp.]|jgi:energy-coupling factor transport system permease protein|nr:energy-coupling factor transporter transmembrane protein EcfT [Treponema sp.]